MIPNAGSILAACIVFAWFLICTALIAADREADGTNASRSSELSEAFTATATFISAQSLPTEVRSAMLEALQSDPAKSSWSGRTGDHLFAIAARRLPDGTVRQRALPGMLRLTNAVAVSELMKTKAVLDAYAEKGFTDTAALRTAVDHAAKRLAVTGSVRGAVHQAAAQDDFAVGYVVADRGNIINLALRLSSLAEVKAAYRDTVHEQISSSMEQEQWAAALDDWQHLRELGLTSEALCIDAARCLIELDQAEEATRIAQDFLSMFRLTATPATLEQLGDLLLEVDAPAAQDVAAAAYRAASERLRSFRGESKSER